MKNRLFPVPRAQAATNARTTRHRRDAFALLALLIAYAGTGITAATAAENTCTGAAAHAFDFWLGDWDIHEKILAADGTFTELTAATSVSTALDGCALVEHWRGDVQFFWEGMAEPAAMTGFSVRAYDPDSGKWRIHWMDSRTPRFGDPYEGNFADGRGDFYRETITPDGRRLDRITFSDIADDAVTWGLSIAHDGGTSWQTIWIMNMQRRPTATP